MPKVNKLHSPKLRLMQALSVATFTQNFMRIRCTVMEKHHQTFQHTLVCVTTFTVPVHLHGTYFAPFLLLTGRCYDAETGAILLLLKRGFCMISFLKRFGEVIISSNFERNQRP